MKNLPDDELFNKLKVRLQNFEEHPDDDVWDAISNGMTKPEPHWIRPVERSAVLLAALLMFGTWYVTGTQPEHQQMLSQEGKETTLPLTTSPAQDEVKRILPPAPTADFALPQAKPAEGSHMSVHDTKVSDTKRDARRKTAWHLETPTKSFEDTKDIAYAETINSAITHAADATDSKQLATANQPEPIATEDSLTRPVTISPTLNKTDSLAVDIPSASKRPMKRARSWRLYGVATPSLTFLHVSPSTADDASFVSLNSPGVLSKERFSLQFEMGAQFTLARRFAVFTGLTYYHQSMELSLEQLASGTRAITTQHSTDFTFEPNTTTTTISYDMQNIGLTTGLLYSVSMGKIVHQFGAALQYEYGILQPSSESERRRSNSFLNYRISYRAEYGLTGQLSRFLYSRRLVARCSMMNCWMERSASNKAGQELA